MTSFFHNGIKQARRVIVAVVGFTVLLIGLAMIVLPGPAFIFIPMGLGILAIEFLWARRLMKRVKHKIQNLNKGGIADETK